MSQKIIKSQIVRFLNNQTSEVLAIKGEWGSGKTFAWKKYILEARNEKKIALKKYSYVTLFGTNSLEQLKTSIFENTVDKELIGMGVSLETLKRNFLSLSDKFSRRFFNLIRGVPGLKELNSAIDSLSFLSIRETIICFDDLERKGDKLDLKDIFGLISLLKEERKCKIILIFNENKDVKSKYEMFQEKVVDKELKFNPTAEECADIAFYKTGNINNWMKEFSIRLGIKNIRILKKIQRLVEEVEPMIEEYDEEIMKQTIFSIVLFSWSYFASRSDENIPELESILNYNNLLFNLNEDKEASEKEKKWENTIENYGYTHTDKLDEAIARAVKCGFFVEEEIKSIAKKNNEVVIRNKSKDSFNKTWNIYHESFEDNELELIAKLYESFKKNVKFISITDLNNIISLYRELGENGKASEIIDYYVTKRKDENELFNLNYLSKSIKISDVEINEKFEKQFKKYQIKENAQEILERLIKHPGWGINDEIILSNTTIDQYYSLFKSIDKNPDVVYYINKCLEFGNFSNSTEQQRKIVNNAKEALVRIGKENKINKLRVKQLGINI